MPRSRRKSVTRKPSPSVIKRTESRRLAIGHSINIWNNKVEKINEDLSTLAESSTRHKITKEVQLKKSKSGLQRKIGKAQTNVNKLDEKLNGYRSIIW